MRTTPYSPDKMLPDVQALNEDMAKEVAQNLKGTISIPSHSGRTFRPIAFCAVGKDQLPYPAYD